MSRSNASIAAEASTSQPAARVTEPIRPARTLQLLHRGVTWYPSRRLKSNQTFPLERADSFCGGLRVPGSLFWSSTIKPKVHCPSTPADVATQAYGHLRRLLPLLWEAGPRRLELGGCSLQST